jgi:alkylation response protein AidB-like acyl-CoA dehydrogenase
MFALTEEQRMAVDGFRRYAEKELRPLADHYERSGTAPDAATVKQLFKKLDEFGVVTGPVSVEDGGAGIELVTQALLFEELAWAWPDLATSVLIQTNIVAVMATAGTEVQRKKYLGPLLASEMIGCFCISEPEVGSNVAAVQTRARPDGDGWIVNGQKLWITNGSWSDFAVVVCRTGDAGSNEISLVIVDQEAGYTTRDIHKMGLNASVTSEVFFDDARASADAVLGGRGTGLKQTLQAFERARIYVGLTSVGVARAALEEAIAYAQQRVQHGKPIAGHQLIQGYIAEMATELDAARLLCLRAMSMLQQGVRCDTESSMAKWYATEMGVRVTSKALQIHGGCGITKAFRVERHFRNARIMTIPDGTTEIQKLIVARNLLGARAF